MDYLAPADPVEAVHEAAAARAADVSMPRQPMPVAGEPHRVLHVLKHCGYGNGNVHVAVDLACAQAQAGYEVWVVSCGGTFVPMLEQHGVRHISLVQDLRKPFVSLASAVKLVRLCRRIKPAIIHAHMMGSAAIGYLAARLLGVPLITTVHNSFDPHSVIMRLGNRVVAVSNAERDQLIKKGYDPARVAVVVNAPNDSPREAFMVNDRVFHLERPCVTVICGLHRRKGVFDVIEAFSASCADFPEWRLYIAGEGPDRQELEAQVSALGLADRVVFLGFVSSPKPLFSQSDIFVLASYADPGSLSIGEARRAGCTIIATAVGGTAEMLGYGEAGRLISPGAPKQLAVQMRSLMRDPAARRALGEAARAGSEAFSVRHLVERYQRVYSDAMSQHPALGNSKNGGAVPAHLDHPSLSTAPVDATV